MNYTNCHVWMHACACICTYMDSLKVVQKVVLEKKRCHPEVGEWCQCAVAWLSHPSWTRICSGQQHLRCCRTSEITVGWDRLDVKFWEKTEVQHPLITCLLRCGKVRSAYCACTSDCAWWDQEATAGAGYAFKLENYVHFFILFFFFKFKPWSWQRDWGKIALLRSILHR